MVVIKHEVCTYTPQLGNVTIPEVSFILQHRKQNFNPHPDKLDIVCDLLVT